VAKGEKNIMICPECGKEFTGRKRKYCSRDCMWEYQRKERKEKSEAKRRRICKWCGKEFIMSWYSGKGGRGETKEGQFCSRKCRGLYRQSLPKKNPKRCLVYFKKCVVCGKQFTTRYNFNIVCSEKCKKKKQQVLMFKRNKNLKIIKTRVCKECGKLFIPEYGDKRNNYCSKKCSRRLNGRIGKASRRVRKHANGYEAFDPFDVFKRDGWRCQLCGVKTPKRLRGTIKDNAPELDHIVSLANGGEHSMRNTQCLCRKCNHSKGIKTLGQLRLFG
jgi:5-methylcytosine-specific restriction endonuclease McrA